MPPMWPPPPGFHPGMMPPPPHMLCEYGSLITVDQQSRSDYIYLCLWHRGTSLLFESTCLLVKAEHETRLSVDFFLQYSQNWIWHDAASCSVSVSTVDADYDIDFDQLPRFVNFCFHTHWDNSIGAVFSWAGKCRIWNSFRAGYSLIFVTIPFNSSVYLEVINCFPRSNDECYRNRPCPTIDNYRSRLLKSIDNCRRSRPASHDDGRKAADERRQGGREQGEGRGMVAEGYGKFIDVQWRYKVRGLTGYGRSMSLSKAIDNVVSGVMWLNNLRRLGSWGVGVAQNYQG